jgi:hypothetical protein
MAYKKIDQYFSFADIAINKNADKNRSLIFLRKVDNTIEWNPVEKLLIKHYQTGKSRIITKQEQKQRKTSLIISRYFITTKDVILIWEMSA